MARKPSGIFETALLERCRILISGVPLHEVPSRLIQPDWFRQLIAHTGNEKAALQLINLPRPEDPVGGVESRCFLNRTAKILGLWHPDSRFV